MVLTDRRSESRLSNYLAWNVLLGAVCVVATAVVLLVPGPLTHPTAEQIHVPAGLERWYGAVLLLLGAPTIFFAISALLRRDRP